MIVRIILVLLLTLTTSACDLFDDKPEVGKYGSLDPALPEYAATEFFDYIYHDKNIDKVLDLSTPTLSRLIASYHTNRNVQRNVLNLRFDEVVITPHTGSAGRSEFAKETKVIMFFEGTLNDKIIKDMRIVDMVRVDNRWKVDKVSPK